MLDWLRRRLAKPRDISEWTMATGSEDNLPVLIRTRVRAPQGMSSDAFPHTVEIVWRFDARGTNGMPDTDLTVLMMKCEGALDSLESGDSGFLGISITGNGRREWVWYVADADAFRARVRDLLARTGNRYPLELQ
jgi:hypothetical protein